MLRSGLRQRELELQLQEAINDERVALLDAQVIQLQSDKSWFQDRLLEAAKALEATLEREERLQTRLDLSEAARDAMDAAMHSKRFSECVGKRVVVYTVHEHTVEGVLTDVYPDAIVLKHAFYVQAADGSKVNLPGDHVMERGRVEWVQELELAHAED